MVVVWVCGGMHRQMLAFIVYCSLCNIRISHSHTTVRCQRMKLNMLEVCRYIVVVAFY